MIEYIDSGSKISPPFTTDYHAKQLLTHNLFTDDMENINNTNKGRDILLANKPPIVSWRTERMLQMIQRHSGVTLHRSKHPKWKQEQTEKSTYGLDRLQKGILYGSAKQENKLSQNVQNITQNHKLHRKTMKNWTVELTAGGKAWLKQRSKEGFSKEMHCHPYYS